MNVKKLRRKCGVRGCKNVDTYSISLSSEAGNTVIICKSCLGKALGAIDDAGEVVKDARVSPGKAPALFFNRRTTPAAPAVEETPAEEPQTEEAVEEAPAEAEEAVYECPHCGQICKSELGLQRHIEAKHKDVK